MESKKEEITEEEFQERQWRQELRDLKIANARSCVLSKQITEAYEILENIRFDYLGDTAFRGKIVKAKKGLENALTDFLLSGSYWENRIEKHHKLTPKEYDEILKNPNPPTQSP